MIKRYKVFIIILISTSVFLLDFIFTKLAIKPIFDKTILRVKHDVYHHSLLPNIDKIEFSSKVGYWRIITNSLGFRDKENRNISLNKNNYRIVLIGDSVTEGVLLDWRDTFPGMLEENLSKKDIQVLNAGVTSYSPSIYYSKIKYYLNKGFEFDELFVFIDVSDIEDEAIIYRIKNSKIISIDQKLEQNIKNKNFKANLINFLHQNLNLTFHILKKIEDLFFDQNLEDFLINLNKSKRYNYTHNNISLKEYQLGFDNSFLSMSKLNDLCKKNNIKLNVVIYPSLLQFYKNEISSIYVKNWTKFSKKNSINLINLFPIFLEEYDKKDILKIIKKYFLHLDVHFNKEGNKLISDYILKSNF